MMAANAALTGLAAAPDLLPPDRALDIVGGCSLPGNQHPALVDAAFPAVMEIGEPGSSTLELTLHVRARPAPGWLARRVTTRHVSGGYHEEDFEIWASSRSSPASS